MEELNIIVQSSTTEREVWKTYIRELETKVAEPQGDAIAIEQLRAQHALDKSELTNEIEVAYALVASTELEVAEWRAQLEQSLEHFALEKQSYASQSAPTPRAPDCLSFSLLACLPSIRSLTAAPWMPWRLRMIWVLLML